MDAHAWDERYAAAELVWSAGPNRFVAEELVDLPPGRALDVACGEGRNALWLAGLGWQVTALDFSEVALRKGRELQAHRQDADPARPLAVEWVHGDVLGQDLGTQRFDLTVTAYLQLPEQERAAAVRRTFAALRPGGTFFLIAHDSSNLAEGTGGPQDPAVLFTAEEVLADLDGERFEVERAERVARPVEDPDTGERATAYDALVRLVRAPLL
jgi:SAM-dependent methyltransferase